jgi:hypothetical protein
MKLDEVWLIRTRDVAPGTPFVFSARALGGDQAEYREPMCDHGIERVILALEGLLMERRVKAVMFRHENDAPADWLRSRAIAFIRSRWRGRRGAEISDLRSQI